LRIQKPPDATPLTASFPTQDTREHEHEQNQIGDERRENSDSGVQDVIDYTKAFNGVATGCECD
jgi:hypothetical protein